MAFKIQDLMTDVLPEHVRWASCSGGTTCRGGNFAGSKGGGGPEKPSPPCRPVSRGGDSPRPNPKPPRPPADYADYADLSLLRRQLQRTLSAQA